jgi:hypothetical protein
MTLIAGTPTWSGICIGSDTRATHKNTQPVSYTDDILKVDILPQGVGIAVAGNCSVATIFRDVLAKNLSENRETSTTYEGPSQIIVDIVKKSLIEITQIEEISRQPSNITKISGLISLIDIGVPMRLSNKECQKLIQIIKNKNPTTQLWVKYGEHIRQCALSGEGFVELYEYPHSVLVSFQNVIGSATQYGILDVHVVPMGTIEAWGSGVSGDHEEQELKTLEYILFGVEPGNVDAAAIHLLRTHGWSERVVPPDPLYKFRTFGGGYLAGAFIPMKDYPERVEFRVSKGEFYRDSQHTDLICSVYEQNGDLYVKTSEGKEWKLIKFWQYQNKPSIDMEVR